MKGGSSSNDGGKLVILTAPLTEIIDHAGFFIQMAMASMPVWMERVMNRKYPQWHEVERNEDGSARSMPAGIRLLEQSLLRSFSPEDVIACYPDDVDRFIGPNTRVVAVSTHNPLGVTFAAGVYTSVFGTSKHPINSHYSRQLFIALQKSPWRKNFRVIVGGSGAWQISETGGHDELGIDCVIEGRSESPEILVLFRKAIQGEDIPKEVSVPHPKDVNGILQTAKRTTFGVVEMTTGCGRGCRFCLPDLSPQMDLPKEHIKAGILANVRDGNRQISLATQDMFIWGQVHTGTPFCFPNREALLDLYSTVVNTPGVEQIVLSHSTMAPAVVDPVLIERLSDILLNNIISISILNGRSKAGMLAREPREIHRRSRRQTALAGIGRSLPPGEGRLSPSHPCQCCVPRAPAKHSAHNRTQLHRPGFGRPTGHLPSHRHY